MNSAVLFFCFVVAAVIAIVFILLWIANENKLTEVRERERDLIRQQQRPPTDYEKMFLPFSEVRKPGPWEPGDRAILRQFFTSTTGSRMMAALAHHHYQNLILGSSPVNVDRVQYCAGLSQGVAEAHNFLNSLSASVPAETSSPESDEALKAELREQIDSRASS